ncbi:MAG: SDR family oxidoreductase [Methanomassiliicoccales archaeon]|jgi:NAD(P)-dependent dehydrogenase (short-subunit alcohol dehydrogenase family)|nr:SDR family oxidoreductase [Methanomassiliicoccales archaeon]MDD1755887.1 SDR family oxidoreductase [Methanomassiliicoccales archaeon]
MVGKVVFITGATSGMGLATARALATYGASIVIHGRDEDKAKQTVEEIQDETKNPAIYYLIADFEKMDEVRRLANDFRRQFHRLDVLINNAGAVFGKRQESMDGIELTLQVNYLTHFLLTNLLLDMLKTSAPSRIINITSGLHERGRIDFEDLQMTRKFSGQKAYASSKLAQVLFTYEMAKRLEGSGVTCNASSPGLAKTHLGYDAGLLTSLSKRFVDLFGKSAEKAAENTIFLATAPELESISGKYFEDKGEAESSEMSYNTSAAQRLWEVSMKLTKLTDDSET